MPINPNISLQYKGLQLQDPLQSYGRALQIKQTQQQMAAQEQDRAALEQFRQKVVSLGGPDNLDEIANAYLGTGRPDLMKIGLDIQAKLQAQSREQEAMNALMGRSAAPAAAPAAAAPAAQPMMPGANGTTIGRVTPQSAVLGRPLGAPGATPPPTNAMAAPAPVATPVNAMMTQPAPTNQTAEINRLMDVAMRFPGTPAGKAAMERAKLMQQMMPKPVSDTELVRNYEYAVKQGYPGTLEQFRESTRSVTNINMPSQQRAEDVEYGKFVVKQFEDVTAAARTAARTIPALESNLATLDKGFETGFGTEAKATGARILGALGVAEAEKYATDAQTFLANASAAVLQKQLDQKGPQTEADAQRITQTGAQLGNTKEANRFLLKVAQAQLRRDIEQRDFYAKWKKDKGTFVGAEDAWYAGEGGKSLFERPELKKYTSAQQQPKVDTRKPLSEIFGGSN